MIALLATLLIAPIAGASGTPSSAAATGGPATSTYDTAAYVYDAPAWLSSQSTVVSYMRGSPSGPEAVSWGRSASVRGGAVAANTVPASTVRFSQGSVNGAAEIEASMRANGWVGDAIDVVRMPDGGLTSLDNTRLLAANGA